MINASIFLCILLNRKNKISSKSAVKLASVVIAFKNESKNLPRLLSALMNQTIESKKFEVILVDDYSSDNSSEVVRENISNSTNFRLIKNTLQSGKKNAIQEGIKNSNGEIIILTDADCIPHPDWINQILIHYDDETDLVYGYSPIISEKSLFNKFCQYENLFTSTLMTAFHNVEFPYLATGRNLSYRKSVFERLNGFQEIKKSLSGDDDLFFQLAVRKGFKTKLMNTKESVVFTRCKQNFSQYFKQKTRHISASKFYFNDIKLSLGFIYTSNIFLNLILFPAFLFMDKFLLSLILFNWMIKFFTLSRITQRIGMRYPLYLIPLFDFLYSITLIFIGIRSRIGSVSW